MQNWNAWAKSWGGSWAKSWGAIPQSGGGGGGGTGVWLGNYPYRRQVEQVKQSPVKKVRKAAVEVAEYLDTGALAQAALARVAVEDALNTLKAYISPDLMTLARNRALDAMNDRERKELLLQLEAWKQLLADDEEAIIALLIN